VLENVFEVKGERDHHPVAAVITVSSLPKLFDPTPPFWITNNNTHKKEEVYMCV
jgi:hypothetical protein